MTPKRRRLLGLLAAGALLGAAALLVFRALDDTLVFFYSPTELAAREVRPGEAIRLGGLVQDGSVERAADSLEVRFVVTDGASDVEVTFVGILPDLFREGQGVVAEGSFSPEGTFAATEVLARHDENYMPKEVADAIRRQGLHPEDRPAYD